MNYYGYGNPEEVARMVHRICYHFHTPDLRYKMICGIIAAETQFGTYPDRTESSGIGIMQFDPIAFEDVQLNTRQKYRDLVSKQFEIKMDLVNICCLRYDVSLSVIYGILKLLRIPELLPDRLEWQAHYWKIHWNTSSGKGSIQHYIDSYNKWKKIIGEYEYVSSKSSSL